MEPDQVQDGVYWRRHAREPVAFAEGVKTMADLGVDVVLEIGPRSVLAPMAASSWPESPQTPAPVVLSSPLPTFGRRSGDPKRRWFRGGGRGGVPGEAPDSFRGTLLRGDAATDFFT